MKSMGYRLGMFLTLVLLLPAALEPMRGASFADVPLAQAQIADEEQSISLLTDTQMKKMELEDYVMGVVLAEMPTSFHSEALMAQAVVARTFALKVTRENHRHEEDAVCTNPGCCQGYVSPEEYEASFGSAEDIEKVREAVEMTRGMILTYAGKIAEATYFSCASGSTEDAVAVWGQSFPYLVAKQSPENALEETLAFSSSFLERALNTALGDEEDDWFSEWTYTPGGGVDRVKIGSHYYTGLSLREKLGLRSTAFDITIQNDVVFFHTKGYGHRVGMSQYGAQALAQEGEDFWQILQYYYPGTRLQPIGAE